MAAAVEPKGSNSVIVDVDDRVSLYIDLPKDNYTEFRKQLFANGLSTSEFFSQVSRMLVSGDPAARAIIEAAKKLKAQTNEIDLRLSKNASALYNVLETRSPVK